jgi:hypothetical protein
MKANNLPSDQDSDEFSARLEEAMQVLEEIVDDRGLLAHVQEPLRRRFLMAAGRVSRPGKLERLALSKARIRKGFVQRRDADEQLLNTTRIRRERDNPIFLTPRNQGKSAVESPQPIGKLVKQRKCYVCQTL